MAVGDIRSNDVMAVVDDIARTAPATADRVQTVISSVLTYAVREQIIPYNPARGIPRRAANIPRDRLPLQIKKARLPRGSLGRRCTMQSTSQIRGGRASAIFRGAQLIFWSVRSKIQ